MLESDVFGKNVDLVIAPDVIEKVTETVIEGLEYDNFRAERIIKREIWFRDFRK